MFRAKALGGLGLGLQGLRDLDMNGCSGNGLGL